MCTEYRSRLHELHKQETLRFSRGNLGQLDNGERLFFRFASDNLEIDWQASVGGDLCVYRDNVGVRERDERVVCAEIVSEEEGARLERTRAGNSRQIPAW